MDTSKKSNFKIILLAVSVAILLIISSLYFFVWRPSGIDYSSATEQTKNMDMAIAKINTELNTILYSTDIDDGLVTNLQNTLGKYTNNLNLLSKNTVISRDSKLKDAYDQNSNAYKDYGQSIDKLVNSMEKYNFIIRTCSYLNAKIPSFSKTTEFDSAAKECLSDIDAVKTSSGTLFYDQYLKDYVISARELVTAYRDNVVAGESGIATISLDNVSLAEKKILKENLKKLDLTTIPTPKDALQKLENVLTNQKSQLIR